MPTRRNDLSPHYSMIALSRVTCRLGGRVVLQDLDLTLTEHRIGIAGSNGSGKSTFARLLNGLVLPDDGEVRVFGLDTRRDGRAVRRRVGFVFQNPDHGIVYPTVAEDVGFGLGGLRLPPGEASARVEAALERFGLTPLRDRSAHLLSGGEKQLLAIAGVLVMRPDLVVFDEPTTLLDLRNSRRIAATIAALPEAAVVVSHDLDLLQAMDRVLVFDAGRLVDDGPPAPTLARYRAAMTRDAS